MHASASSKPSGNTIVTQASRGSAQPSDGLPVYTGRLPHISTSLRTCKQQRGHNNRISDLIHYFEHPVFIPTVLSPETCRIIFSYLEIGSTTILTTFSTSFRSFSKTTTPHRLDTSLRKISTRPIPTLQLLLDCLSRIPSRHLLKFQTRLKTPVSAPIVPPSHSGRILHSLRKCNLRPMLQPGRQCDMFLS
ncbi:hypothetical protein BJ508DRAFT_136314 [Ascobolus immersus RN42]|uniref:Uncharacterized protein n=1 Tax=Ascobolus immersus RN42 TaxID=1160509 RepID=A0A3N4IKG5_ASCIM|nr:hypothetical protein BJ508DRAFT_136314 [Ascobolus immersus RN42]